MPGTDDWVNAPLHIVQRFYDECGVKEYSSKVEHFFREKTEAKSQVTWIPSLNDVPLHHLQNNTLVRFRGMIQDMFDPEFYLGAYEVKNTQTGKRSMRSGKYKDLAQCAPDEKVDQESKQNTIMERQMLYCIPIPAENPWVKNMFADEAGKASKPQISSSSRKRGLEDDSEDVDMEVARAEDPTSVKKTKTDAKPNGATHSSPDLNFPLPDERGPACLVKVYGDDSLLKLNDIVEVIGVLSNDPSLANFPDKSGSEEGAPTMEGVEEEETRCPPPSLVPRLHAILVNPWQHANPMLPPHSSLQADSLLNEVAKLREDIMAVLSEALLGDELAAQYLLCHLISTVYHRQDVIALGKFSLNLSQCPSQSPLPQLLSFLLQRLTVKSHFLPLTLDNMNKLMFIPHKDYPANRLTSGLLQLSAQTNLIVDETALQAGQLDANGVANMTALGNVISWQKMEYDFNFHKQDFPTDILVVIISEGKSILKCDCHVPLSPTRPASEVESIYSGIETYLTAELLAKIRSFLTLVQNLKYSLADDVQKIVQEDFVERRKVDSNAFSVDDFHALLVLTRLLSLSFGQSSLSVENFSRAKEMESKRQERLRALPRSTSHTSAAS